MERLVIDVPEQKSSLVKQLLKDLGVIIQNSSPEKALALKINKMIKPGKKPSMDEIIEEVNAVRFKK